MSDTTNPKDSVSEKVRAQIKGRGFCPQDGGFAEVIINGRSYTPEEIVSALAEQPLLSFHEWSQIHGTNLPRHERYARYGNYCKEQQKQQPAGGGVEAVADVIWRIDNEADQFIPPKGMIYLRYLRDLLATLPPPARVDDAWTIAEEGDTCLVQHPQWGRHVFHAPPQATRPSEPKEMPSPDAELRCEL